MKKILILIFFFINILFANNLQTYKKTAIDLKLWDERYWKLLLHMPQSTSEIDSPEFFLAKNGKNSAKDELLATLEHIYNEKTYDDNSTICKYPARTFWLEKKLNLKDLPKVKCQKYDELVKKMDPKAVSLVFPTAHINSPASMFGHTFLRIDSSYNSKLLSYAINYAAKADQSKENGLVFAIKGLIGGYYGKYSLLPYYDKLKEYGDTEQRDIWEYDLNLNQKEVDAMIRHIWELSDTYSEYFFFDENCSYNMLWLIEVAREDIYLRDKFTYQVSPPETLYALEEENLVKDVHFRASKRLKLLAYEKVLSKKGANISKDLSKGIIEPSILDNSSFLLEQKQYILESAIELSEYNYIERKIDKKKYLEIFHNLTSYRATLGKGTRPTIIPPSKPTLGHRAFKLTLQGKFEEDENNKILFGLRPAYHDLSDSDEGFLQGTQIEFMDWLAYFDDGIQTEHLTLLSISSIALRSEFFKPFSWRTKFSFDKEGFEDSLRFNANIGFGYAWNIFDTKNYFYTLLDNTLYANKKYNFSTGPTLGVVLYEGAKFKTNLEGSYKAYNSGNFQEKYSIKQSYFLTKDNALFLSYDHIEHKQDDTNKVIFGVNIFF